MKTITLILITIFLLALCGCAAHEVVVTKEHNKIEYRDKYIDRIRIDSFKVHDSIYLERRNDTVFYNKYKYVYRYKMLHDTVSINHHDSVYISEPTIIKDHSLSFVQRIKLYIGEVCVVLVILGLVFKKLF